MASNPVLSISDLQVHYEVSDGQIQAVDGVSFDVGPSEIIGIVGESGCGKTTLVQSITRALPANGHVSNGRVLLNGKDLLEMDKQTLQSVRWEEIAYVPQSAMGSLDPVFTIRSQLVETIKTHRPSMSKSDAVSRSIEMLEMVGIDPERLDDYPHQLSGGMRQRVLLAMAFLLNPDVVIADEPTTGLDVLIRDKVLADIERFRDEFETSLIVVSHDIADLVETCDYLFVMYGGKLVEMGPSEQVFEAPRHPYTIGLKQSIPEIYNSVADLISMGMVAPDLKNPPKGCRFINKCPFKIDHCRSAHPDYQTDGSGAKAACYRADEAEQMRDQASNVSWSDE